MGLFKTTGVSKFRIFVDTPRNGQNYRRGDLVQGNVFLSCATAIKYRLIQIQLIGKLSNWNTDPPVLDKVLDNISYLKTPAGGTADAVGCLAEGEYHFPFAIRLPENALASCSSTHNVSVTYFLNAIVQREGSVFNNTEEQEIFVAAGMSREQFNIEGQTPQQLRNCVVPMKNSFMSNSGIVECVASMSGTVLVTSKPTERIQVVVELDASGGKKPVNSAKVELQMVIQSDYMGSKCLTQQFNHNTMQPGDKYMASNGTLKTWTEPHVKSWSTLVAQGTMCPGYVEGQASSGNHVCWDRCLSMWKVDLTGERVPQGGRGRFQGSVMLDTSDARSQECIPTLRGEHCQVNWRIAITLDNCSKSIYMPVVVVDNIVESTGIGAEAPLPWFHHEKFVHTMFYSQQYEVPALGTVVRDTQDQNNLGATEESRLGYQQPEDFFQ